MPIYACFPLFNVNGPQAFLQKDLRRFGDPTERPLAEQVIDNCNDKPVKRLGGESRQSFAYTHIPDIKKFDRRRLKKAHYFAGDLRCKNVAPGAQCR
jgi:hypothetical protein